ncbi:ATP-binding cassette domain-containing protein [Streptomyces niveus]
MIEVNELTKRYGGRTAVDRLSFNVRPEQVTGFLGPNGTGKTTTLRLILGLDAPTGGTARSTADAPHRPTCPPWRTATGSPRGRVDEVLYEVGLADAASRRIGGFSLGMMRRLFRRFATEGRTVLLSSHLMSEMENTADQLVVIGRGRLIAAEPVDDFAARSTRFSVVMELTTDSVEYQAGQPR